MDWIKKNSTQFALLIVAALTIVSAVILFAKVTSFKEGLNSGSPPPSPGGKAESFTTDAIDKAQKAIEMPALWQPSKDAGRLFVSKTYVYKDGLLERPEDKMFNPPVPNKWLMDHGLDPLNAKVLDQDPDRDGFTTREEWDGMDGMSHLDNKGQPVIGPDGQPLRDDSTDPTDPNSHPPYHTKLRLLKVHSNPFRLKFQTHDFDPKKPKTVHVQINTVDRGSRTYFVGLHEKLQGTKYSVDNFEFKEIDAAQGTKKDVSELTVIDDETGRKVVLPIGQIINNPDLQAVFQYLWVEPGKQPAPPFAKKRGETFQLPPENDKSYKLIDIMGDEAVVELPTGDKKTFKEAK